MFHMIFGCLSLPVIGLYFFEVGYSCFSNVRCTLNRFQFAVIFSAIPFMCRSMSSRYSVFTPYFVASFVFMMFKMKLSKMKLTRTCPSVVLFPFEVSLGSGLSAFPGKLPISDTIKDFSRNFLAGHPCSV